MGIQGYQISNFRVNAPYMALTSLVSDPKMCFPITLARLH
ncbi:hypothetical protein MITS9509_01903 [Synechococcus sp. MIT S9509]|nr:hypothetical protein MITS9504_01702 [Synechococcus sp. MIT S9504]KZR91982.1 hypothetical protein MITS9509_01903 [Synechococcus sp. MIT S9509]